MKNINGWDLAVIIIVAFFSGAEFMNWMQSQAEQPPCDPGTGRAVMYRSEGGILVCEIHERLAFGEGTKNPFAQYPSWINIQDRY